MNFNKENILKIVCILVIFSNLFLIIQNYAVPYINNYKIIKQYQKEKKEKTLNQKSEDEIDYSDTEESSTTEQYVYDEYNDLLQKDELSRMKDYVGKYITYINEKDYASAYNLLYDEFKSNYFQTLEDFEKYAKNTYSNDMYIVFNDLKRYGVYYMYEVTIYDMDEIGQDEKKNVISTIFTIKENAILDYVLSFGV